MSHYSNPLSIFFVWHLHDRDVVDPVFQKCFSSLRKDVERPFSRSVSIPVFIRTSEDESIPEEVDIKSQRAIIFSFIGKNCMSDEGWVEYLQDLANCENSIFVPIALDKSAFSFTEGIESINYIRAYDFEPDHFQQRLVIEIFHEVYRHGLNESCAEESCAELTQGKVNALKLFLSHAKSGVRGLSLAKALKEQIDSGQMREFFDSTDIGVGFNFATEIELHVSDSTLIAIHSDSYSSRYWCQREVLEAKAKNRPIIAVDVIDAFEDRRFPLAANVPVIRIPTASDETFEYSDLLRILEAALLETIRFCYSKQVLTEYQNAGWFPENAVISARPPEASSMATIVNTSDAGADFPDFIYPDPPVYREETTPLDQYGVSLYTPLTSSQVDLCSTRIGISISEPEKTNLLKIGQTDQHLILLLQDVARYVLGSGAELVYGGDLRPGGFTEFLFQEAHALQSRLKSQKVHLTNHIAWPIYLSDLDDVRDWKASNRSIALMQNHSIPDDVEDLGIPSDVFLPPSDPVSSFAWARSLTEMRGVMVSDCDVRISSGGRTSGYKGYMPGVLEEILLALKMGKPLFLVGGFGGITQSVCNLKGTGVLPEELTFAWQQDNNAGLREMVGFALSQGIDYECEYETVHDAITRCDLNNGLTPEENEILFTTPFVDQVVHLILKGLARLP